MPKTASEKKFQKDMGTGNLGRNKSRKKISSKFSSSKFKRKKLTRAHGSSFTSVNKSKISGKFRPSSSGVALKQFWVKGLAPTSKKYFTRGLCPKKAAAWSGVLDIVKRPPKLYRREGGKEGGRREGGRRKEGGGRRRRKGESEGDYLLVDCLWSGLAPFSIKNFAISTFPERAAKYSQTSDSIFSYSLRRFR
jgi:hypothetical protein